MNSEEELNFIREGLKVYGDIWSYYIGGSADADRDTIEYSDYYPDESGNHFILFSKHVSGLSIFSKKVFINELYQWDIRMSVTLVCTTYFQE